VWRKEILVAFIKKANLQVRFFFNYLPFLAGALGAGLAVGLTVVLGAGFTAILFSPLLIYFIITILFFIKKIVKQFYIYFYKYCKNLIKFFFIFI
jgi:hypothetical protein